MILNIINGMNKNIPYILLANNDCISEMINILKHEGYNIEIAQTSIEVIKKIQNNFIDVLIIDFELLGTYLYDILSIIKKINPRLKIIIISNNISLEIVKQIRQIGIFYYSIKPLDFEEIKSAVKVALLKQ